MKKLAAVVLVAALYVVVGFALPAVHCGCPADEDSCTVPCSYCCAPNICPCTPSPTAR